MLLDWLLGFTGLGRITAYQPFSQIQYALVQFQYYPLPSWLHDSKRELSMNPSYCSLWSRRKRKEIPYELNAVWRATLPSFKRSNIWFNSPGGFPWMVLDLRGDSKSITFDAFFKKCYFYIKCLQKDGCASFSSTTHSEQQGWTQILDF